jgi:hypothetical protein
MEKQTKHIIAKELYINAKLILLAIGLCLVSVIICYCINIKNARPLPNTKYNGYYSFVTSLLPIEGYRVGDGKYDLRTDCFSSDPGAFETPIDEKHTDKDCLNSLRAFYFVEDLETTMQYSIIISVIVLIVGRYIILGVKWVNKNK